MLSYVAVTQENTRRVSLSLSENHDYYSILIRIIYSILMRSILNIIRIADASSAYVLYNSLLF